MMYLLQILSMLDNQQLEYFRSLFSDLSFEIEEMGYKGHEEQLVNEMLDNHFGLFVEDERQLKHLTAAILRYPSLDSALKISTLKRGA